MVWGRFFTKLFLVWVPLSETENRHETGPQSTDLAENPPILIRIGRGIRFRPPRGPGRPKPARKRQKQIPKKSPTFFGMGAGFRNENRHETGPQGTDLAENSPILIRIGRGIRFRPPRGPGRPKNGQNGPVCVRKKLTCFFVWCRFSPPGCSRARSKRGDAPRAWPR